MSSRQEAKRRRREERRAREEAARRAAEQRRRVQLAVGGLGVVAIVVIAVLGVSGVLGGSGEPAASAQDVQIPPTRLTDLDAAAEAAGCRVVNARYEGAAHETRDFRPADYDTNPPTSGNHEPEWYEDGIYPRGALPRLGMLVHTLEHGRINLQYAPGTAPRQVARLEKLTNELDGGYHMLLYENTTDMPYAVAATAWTHLLGCREMNDRVFDAVRAFRARYIDKGPEQVP